MGEAIDRARAPRGIYLITPDWSDTRRLCETIVAAIEGGAGAIQYRNKIAAAALRRDQARALARIVQSAGLAFLVDNDAALAVEVGADGLHVGRDDGDVTDLRATLPPAMMLGVSCYGDLALVSRAVAAGAAYVAMGAMSASNTKVGATLAPVERIGEARALGAHVVASGGINRDNIALMAAAGAQAVGIVSAIFDATDPARATADLKARFAMGVPAA